jgi:hypothetical protein
VLVSWWAWRQWRVGGGGPRAFASEPTYEDARIQPYTPPYVYQHKHIVTLGRALSPEVVLPKYFKYKEALMTPVRSQGKCASCWAFAVADCLADRVSMHTRGQVRENLSAQELLSCLRPRLFPCEKGGLPELAFHHVVARGLPTEAVYPYENFWGGPIDACKQGSLLSLRELLTKAKDRHEKRPDRVFAEAGTVRSLCKEPVTHETLRQNILNMKTEIFLNGPIVGTIMVYDDLYRYRGESVYEVSSDAVFRGGHAIEIFGWADAGQNTEEKGFEGAYWICRNSWGLIWPRDLPKDHAGWMYVRMGRNEAGIESRASCAQPMLTEAMKAMGKESSWHGTSYLSYDEYVNDPEKKQFFSHLAKRRKQKKEDN